MLALIIDSEHKLDIDMLKVLKMLSLHKLEEILMPDYTIRLNITLDEKRKNGKKSVEKVVAGLLKKDEINNNSKCASDFWIEYDKTRYQDDEIFKSLIEDIKNIDNDRYQKIRKKGKNVRQEV